MYVIKLKEHLDRKKDQKEEAIRIRTTLIVPALKKHAKVCLDLEGFGRWTRSFLNEAIGGLIREDGYTREQLKEQMLVIPPKFARSIGGLVEQLINIAEMQRVVKRDS